MDKPWWVKFQCLCFFLTHAIYLVIFWILWKNNECQHSGLDTIKFNGVASEGGADDYRFIMPLFSTLNTSWLSGYLLNKTWSKYSHCANFSPLSRGRKLLDVILIFLLAWCWFPGCHLWIQSHHYVKWLRSYVNRAKDNGTPPCVTYFQRLKAQFASQCCKEAFTKEYKLWSINLKLLCVLTDRKMDHKLN